MASIFSSVQFSSVQFIYFTNFMNTKENTFTIKMYNTSRKKERKKTNCKLFTKIKFDYTIITD